MNERRERLEGRRRSPSWLLRAAGLTLATWCALPTARAQDPALARIQRIEQDKLINGEYPFRHVVEIGRHLFTTPFTKADGYGEGGRRDKDGARIPGPREAAFQQRLEQLRKELGTALTVDDLRRMVNFTAPAINQETGESTFPYFRLNGLDAQSCFECHNSIGSARLPDARSYALTRRQGTVGGPAGFASSVFVNPDLPIPVFKFIRNPPHLFGTGYAEKLGIEMTTDLLAQKLAALRQAISQAGTKVEVPLESKAISFGSYFVTFTGKAGDQVDLMNVLKKMTDQPCQNVDPFVVDCSRVQGVSPDLVVRPLQWKGIASSHRNISKDSLQFHFGIEAREKNPNFNMPNEEHDHDADGHADEVSVGDVSALTIYTMTIRPPSRVVPLRKKERESVERGWKIFSGELVVAKEKSCWSCHRTSLKLESPIAVIKDPRADVEEFGPVVYAGNGMGLSAPLESSIQLPTFRRFLELNPIGAMENKTTTGEVLAAVRKASSNYDQSYMGRHGKRGYAFSLTELQPASGDEQLDRQRSDPLPESQPRLSENADGSIDVPLFSDLRRHKMGALLSERKGFVQETDVSKITVPEDEFLTRSLWGVADTGPWLHDGRAQSLKDAILFHDSEGSEAHDVIQAFKGLNQEDQENVINFLLSLRLPLDPRYSFDNFP